MRWEYDYHHDPSTPPADVCSVNNLEPLAVLLLFIKTQSDSGNLQQLLNRNPPIKVLQKCIFEIFRIIHRSLHILCPCNLCSFHSNLFQLRIRGVGCDAATKYPSTEWEWNVPSIPIPPHSFPENEDPHNALKVIQNESAYLFRIGCPN